MRPLRALFLANDGSSAGHVTRALAVARALLRAAPSRGVPVEPLLVTTSAADALIAWAGVPAVRLPTPGTMPEDARRRLCTALLESTASAFAPDLLVTDTFPSGPQLEAASILETVRHRALIRRRVKPDAATSREISTGLEAYHLVLAPDDPGPADHASGEVPAAARRVSPITLSAPALSRASARAALSLPDHPLALISCGGGGDAEGRSTCEALAAAVRAHGRWEPVIAAGPLFRGAPRTTAGTRVIVPMPLGSHLAAFDVALLAAGYNTAHEAAQAALPAGLFARPRRFDDQHARAARFTAAGLATVFTPENASVILDLLKPPATPLAASGAAEAAHALLDLVGA